MAVEKDIGLPYLACCHCDPYLDKCQKMDGWMEEAF